MGQTTVQTDNAVLFGSAKIELGLYSAGLGGLVNIGAANGVEFTFPPTQEIIEFDNTEEWRRYTNAEKATITGTLFEASGANIAKLLAGIAKSTPVAGAEVTVSTPERHVVTDTNAVRLDNKMGNGTEVSTIVAVADDNEALDRNTDYVVAVDNEGYTTVARVAESTKLTDGDAIKVTYKYTPNAAVQLDVGGITDQEYLIARLTNHRPTDSKDYVITCWKVALAGDLKWAFAKDKDLQPFGVPFTLEAIKDQTRTNKEQLFRIYDEQSVA